MLTQSGQA